MSGRRTSIDGRIDGIGRRVDGDSEECRATGAFVAEGPVLVGGLRVRENRIWHAKIVWMVLEVVHWDCNHRDNSCLGWCRASFSLVSGFYFIGIHLPFFLRLRATAPLWGGSDVVHCVWVPLIGTIVAAFWPLGSLVGIGFLYIFIYFVQNCVHWRPLYPCLILV